MGIGMMATVDQIVGRVKELTQHPDADPASMAFAGTARREELLKEREASGNVEPQSGRYSLDGNKATGFQPPQRA